MHPLIERAKKEGRPLLETEALGLLSAYGIAVPKHRFAQTSREALEACRDLGWPVVMKVVSPDILHKTEVGGVVLNLRNKRQASKAFARLTSLAKVGYRVDGVLLYPYRDHELELSVGMLRDSQFGPVITFGLGGIWIEVLRDLSYGIAPLLLEEAEEMISRIRGHSILEGARGKKPMDRGALRELLVKVSDLAMKEETIQEMDLNPVFPLEEGFFIADVRVVLS